MTISLRINKGFQWHSNASISIKGYFYDKQNIYYENEHAVNYLKSVNTKEDFIKLIQNINGIFSLIITIDKKTYLASDITRTFPLFYTLKNDELYISDDILYLKNTCNINDFNPISIIELKASNHTHGKKTLLSTVFQVQASEYLIIEDNTIYEQNFFFTYAIKKESSSSYISLKREAILAFENTFKRMLSSLNKKMVVIPLSGGFDSRLIAVMLKKHKYQNVVCYTYGNSNSTEIENSKKTAKELNFKWHFIEYTNDLIKTAITSQEFKEYMHFAGKFSSMPNLQEYFAVKYLKENKLIDKDSIFIPGYAGDVLGGSQFIKVIPKNLKKEEIVALILKTKFNNYTFSSSEKRLLLKEVEHNFKNLDVNHHQKTPNSAFENYDITEKIAKYIFNSASFYNFFEFEHRVPFWDNELLLFFRDVPQEYKFLKRLFDKVLIEQYFKKFNVHFSKELQPTEKNIYLQKIKNTIKVFFPTFIKQRVLKKNDWNNYQPITKHLLAEMNKNKLKVKRKSNNYNEIITQWYAYFCENKIN